MRSRNRIPAVMALAVALGLASSAGAQQAKPAGGEASLVKAMVKAMEPGEAQKKLDFLVGPFDIKIRTWVDPSKPPFESTATSLATWVLGNRYVQIMLSGYVMGEPWSGIGYAGYDNVANKYVVTYMDSGSTGMEWYTGTMDPDGKLSKLTTTVYDAITGKPVHAEMRVLRAANDDHVTELWQSDPGGKMVKVMELQYTRRKP